MPSATDELPVLRHIIVNDARDDAELAYTNEQMGKRMEAYRRFENSHVRTIFNEHERNLYQKSRQLHDE